MECLLWDYIMSKKLKVELLFKSSSWPHQRQWEIQRKIDAKFWNDRIYDYNVLIES